MCLLTVVKTQNRQPELEQEDCTSEYILHYSKVQILTLANFKITEDGQIYLLAAVRVFTELLLVFVTSAVNPMGNIAPPNFRAILKWFSITRLFHSARCMDTSTCFGIAKPCQFLLRTLLSKRNVKKPRNELAHFQILRSRNTEHKPRASSMFWSKLNAAIGCTPSVVCSTLQRQKRSHWHYSCDWWQFRGYETPQ